MAMPSTDHILIVDDQKTNQLILERILERAEYRTSSVSSGGEALEFVRREAPDLILLDIMMPDMDGYSVLQSIRSIEGLPFVPIMFVTAKHSTADTVTGLDSGADDYLTKPVNRDELLARVRVLLRLKDTRRALQREQEHLSLLYRVSQTLHRSLDVDHVLADTLNTIGNVLGATRGSVLLLDEQGRVWRRILFRPQLPPAEADEAVRTVLRDGLAAHALHTNQIQIVADVSQDPRWQKLPNDDAVDGSALAMPLRSHHSQHSVGVLVLFNPRPDHFTAAIEPLVTALNDQISVALSNASLYTRLREAEESRDSFIQMLTHDLRSPLAGMIGCFDALATTPLSEDGQYFVELGFRAGAVQRRLIDDLLDVYKAEAGRLTLDLDTVSLGRLGELVAEVVGGSALEAGLTLTIELPDEPPAQLDENKMTRVICNLVSNGIKWTPRGGTVRVSGAVDAAAGWVELLVADSGRGIAPDDLAHIFEKFYQGRGHSSVRGTGLGLTFCALVVEAHGGRISAASTLGAGTTMTIRIPWKA
jgi:two-component system cell cycle sensor histidine kinase PleC